MYRIGLIELAILAFCVIVVVLVAAAVVIVLVVRKNKKQPQGTPAGMKKCPYCAELIQAEANVCRYCGRELTNPADPAPSL